MKLLPGKGNHCGSTEQDYRKLICRSHCGAQGGAYCIGAACSQGCTRHCSIDNSSLTKIPSGTRLDSGSSEEFTFAADGFNDRVLGTKRDTSASDDSVFIFGCKFFYGDGSGWGKFPCGHGGIHAGNDSAGHIANLAVKGQSYDTLSAAEREKAMSDRYPAEDLMSGEGFDFDVSRVGSLSLRLGDGLDLLPYGAVMDRGMSKAVLSGGQGCDPCEYKNEWQSDHYKKNSCER